MILIRALETTISDGVDSAVDEVTYKNDLRVRLNYAFANRLKTYIKMKSVDDCMLCKKSKQDGDLSISYFVTYYSPDVLIDIDCSYDIDSTVSGYHVFCDEYTSLVKTIIYEIHNQETTLQSGESKKLLPDTDTGYTTNKTLTYGRYADIQINLGYLSNEDDLSYLNYDSLTTERELELESDIKEHLVVGSTLDNIARRIVEGAYGPPIVAYVDNDPYGNDDPYMYSLSDWHATDNIEGCSGEIVKELYNNIPINSIKLESTVDDKYTWEIPTNYDTSTSCHLIVSYKTSGAAVTSYIEIGGTITTKELNSVDYTVYNFRVDVSQNNIIRIGLDGKGTIWYTALWLSPVEVVGLFDDPRTKYSMYPPGYRNSTSNEVPTYTGDDPITIAITSASDLVGRARELAAEVVTGEDSEETSSAEELASEFTSVLTSVTSQASNVDMFEAKIVSQTSSLANNAAAAANNLINKAVETASLYSRYILLAAAVKMANTAESADEESWNAPSNWSKSDKHLASNAWNAYAKAKKKWEKAKDTYVSPEDLTSMEEEKDNDAKALEEAKKKALESLPDVDVTTPGVNIPTTDDSITVPGTEVTTPSTDVTVPNDTIYDTEEIKALEKKAKESKSKFEKSKKNTVSKEEMENLEKTKDDLKVAFDNLIKTLEERYAELANQHKEVTKNYNDLKDKETAAKKSLDEMKAKISKEEKEIKDLNKKIKDNSNSIAELNAMRSKVSLLNDELAADKEQLNNLELAYKKAKAAAADYYSNNKELIDK